MLRKHNPQQFNLKGSFKKLLMVLVMLGGVMQMNAQNTSQTITLNLRNVNIQEFMKQIESRTNFTFIYRDILMDTKKDVSIQASNRPLVEVVKTVLDQKGLEASYNNNTIVLTKKKEVLQPKTKRITGIVTDTKGEPIIGATIVDTGTKNGTITDFNGSFSLEVNENALIQVSYIGYTQTEIKIGNKQSLNVQLAEDVLALDEVVVVGYGTQKKVNLTGSISVVDAEQIKDRPSSSLINLLQGTVPNLNINMTSGRPGGSGTLNIRGATSINGGSPLVLIDGAEGSLDQLNPNDVASVSVLKDASASAIYGGRAAFGVILVTTKEGETNKVRINYNGNIGIGTPTVSTDYERRGYYSVYINDMFYRSYSGVNYSKYTEADMIELWERRHDSSENPERPWVVMQNRGGKDSYVYYGNTDWFHYLFKDNRPSENHNLSISGGNEKIKFLLSGNFYKQDGIFRFNTDVYKKTNLRSKITAEINDYITLSNNTSFFNSTYTFPGAGAVNNAFRYASLHGLASYVPVNPDGTPTYITIFNSAGIMDGWNALLTHGKHMNLDRGVNFSNTSELTLKIAKGLEIKGNFTYMYNATNSTNRRVNVPYSTYPGVISVWNSGNAENRLSESTRRNDYYATNIYASYKKNFTNHNFSIVGGYNYETRYYKDISVTGWDLLSDDLNDLNLVGINEETGIARLQAGGGQNEYAIRGLFGRINYDYKGKYLLELSTRYDGSSRFMSKDRYVLLPSFSAGWRISEEQFFNPLQSMISNLKLRYSYGSLGNQNVDGYYPFVRTVTTNDLNYLFGGDSKPKYTSFSAPVASNLTWEVVTTNNIGIDFGFLDSRLVFNGDFYIRDTKGMLVPGVGIPAVYGATEPAINAADLRTQGFELQLSWNDKFTMANKVFKYGISLTLSDNTAKITKFDNPNKLLNKYYVGQNWGEIWGYKTELFSSDEEATNYLVDQTTVNTIINSSAGSEQGLKGGDIKFLDLNNDNVINMGSNRVGDSGDRTIIGNSQARFRYGVSLNAQWSGFDVSAFLQGIGKQNWYPGTDSFIFWGPYSRPYATFIAKDFLTNVWSKDNTDAYFPRARGYVALNSTNRSLGVPQDRYLQDLAYLRLKNLTIGYSLPKQITKRILVDKLRVYFSGENLFTSTKLKSDYLDPEQCSADADYTSSGSVYPWSKVFSFGVDITF